ncbi:ParB N-terminal domain-containing protein [Sulfitobacter faviae]|uniref:ParB N-terminal domain-containing protein n=1 Tax=Sulfitobacter faviae TaxID=1775881 RepID=A0ABZ0UZ46_9RHOB|nr:ParB N-terminal domain-containing protein [Sulfitobacter faviae]WPZ20470.1 ParB N-terminal domain-containing protein [Sulfitobacter faviae]
MTQQEQLLTRLRKANVKPADLCTRPEDFQYREMEFENYHVTEIADALRRKGSVDRIDVWRDPKTNELVVLDGHHRFEAHRRVGSVKVPVVIFEGTEEAARLHALDENAKARLPMTATEKSNAAWKLVCLTRDDGEYTYSKATIVKRTAVSDGQVGNMRRARSRLLKADLPIPDSWWGALASLKGEEGRELTDDDIEALIEERARRLDDRVGKDIGRMAEVQIEAVCRMLEKRLGQKTKMLVEWWREDFEAEEDEFEGWPF